MGKIQIGSRQIDDDRHRQYMTTANEPMTFDGVDLTTLKPKMKRFARHYMSTVNVTQSAEASGYTPASGFRLLKRPDVQAYLQWLVTEEANAQIASPTEVLEGLTRAANGEMYDEVVLQNGKKVEKRIDSRDRLTAFVTLSKFHGLLQPEVQVNQQFNINVDIVDSVEDEAEEVEEVEETVEGDFEEIEDSNEFDFSSNIGSTDFLGGIGR